MATITRVSASGAIPVQQAQLIDPNAFRLSGASAEALKTIGGTVTQIGEERERQKQVEAELSRRKRAATDSLSATKGIKARQLADDEIKLAQLDPNEESRQKTIDGIMSRISEANLGLDLTPEAREKEDVEQGAWAAQTTKEVDLFDVSAEIKTDIKVGSATLIDLIGNDDGTPDNAVKIQNQMDSVRESLERDVPAAEAEIALEELVKQGEELQKDNAVAAVRNIAVLNPGQVSESVTAELKARKAGKKPSGEFALLENKDLEDIRDYTKTIGEKRTSDSEIKVTESKVDAFDKIRDGATDIDSMIDAVNADPTISAEDKLDFAKAIPSYFSQWNSTVAAMESDEDAYDTLTQLSEAVERGAASPAAFEEKYAELKSLLDKDDQRAVRKQDIVATKSMQNRTFSDSLLIARPTLVELTSSDLQSIQIARRNKEIINDIEGVNTFNIAIKKNQAEQWNMGRFRKELRSQIAQNSEWSQEQIFVAQEVLIDQLDLPVGELLKQFDEQNPNDAIMKEAPDIVFKDIWKGLDINQKAKVWELRMRGAPASVIKGEFE